MGLAFSKKQKLFIMADMKRLNILEGSVRSGKTFISIYKWANFVMMSPENAVFLMVGKTITSLKRNILDLVEDAFGDNFRYSWSKKEGVFFGRKVYLEGVNDARAENKIRGMTLYGAYCDEITLFTEDFFTMLLSRLSLKGAKLIGTTNPDNPKHWFKEKYLDRENELDINSFFFSLEDNEFLENEYISSIKKEYTGLFYKRFILGLWVSAEGVIYDMFSEDRHIMDCKDIKYEKYYVSIDYGTQNPTVFLMWGLSKGKWYCLKEYYYCGRARMRQKTDFEYADDLLEFCKGRHIIQIIIDPSAASFIAELKKRGFRIKLADNEVLDGIRNVGTCLSNELVYFDKSCVETIKEFYAYVWDSKANDDKPIKENDHSMDSVRYMINTIIHKPKTFDFG